MTDNLTILSSPEGRLRSEVDITSEQRIGRRADGLGVTREVTEGHRNSDQILLPDLVVFVNIESGHSIST